MYVSGIQGKSGISLQKGQLLKGKQNVFKVLVEKDQGP